MSIVAAFMVPHPPMIVPDVGRGSEKQIEKTIRAYEKVADEIAALRPETLIISSPHRIMYADYFHISPGTGASGSLSDFNAPNVKFNVAYDEELVNLLCEKADALHFPAGTLGEKRKELDHGTMVPLWFILKKYKSSSTCVKLLLSARQKNRNVGTAQHNHVNHVADVSESIGNPD